MKTNNIRKILLLCLCMLVSSFILTSCSPSTNPETTEPATIERHYSWPGYTLDEAVDAADHIVYGRVTEKDTHIQRQDISGEALIENDLEIEVIDILKASKVVAQDDKALVYHEIPSPSAERNDIPLNLAVGQEVILFLNPNSLVLGPDYVIPVDQDRVQLSAYLMEAASVSQDSSLSVEEFLEIITK